MNKARRRKAKARRKARKVRGDWDSFFMFMQDFQVIQVTSSPEDVE